MCSITLGQTTLLIFDLDGTLIDSVPDLTNSINFALKNNQLPTHTTNIIRTFVGNGSYKLCERACPDNSDSGLIDMVHHDFLAHYRAYTCIETVAYDGVMIYLPQLVQHYTLAIATNKPKQFLPNILKKFGWEGLFSVVIGGDSLPYKKPDPAPLLHICQTLNISPNQAVMIGDSKNDILAGKNAQMTTLALTYGYNYDEPIVRSEPDFVFDEFEALASFLLTHQITATT